MSTAIDTQEPERPHPDGSSRTASAASAVSVGVLTACTLGIVLAVVTGTGLRLLGVPEAWSLGAAVLVALLSLIPAAALGRQVWRIERYGFHD